MSSLFINELHYDNAGSDSGEGVEVAGAAGTDLSGASLVYYTGSSGNSYMTKQLDGVIPALQGGFGVLAFSHSGIQNGPDDGIALVDASGSVVDFISYEGTLTATNGPADGMTSVDIGVSQSSAEDGRTLQRTGTGSTRDAFSWTGPTASSFGTVNPGQSFVSPTAVPSAAPTNVPSTMPTATMPTATPSGAPSAAPEAHCPDFCTAGGRSVLFGAGTIEIEGIACSGCAGA